MSSQAMQANGSTENGTRAVNAWVGHKGPGGFDLRSEWHPSYSAASTFI